MEFFISPDQKELCQKKLEKIFKCLTKVPEVKYEYISKLKIETLIVHEEGHERKYYKMDAIKVTIDDFTANEWVLVATVSFKDNAVLMSNNELFKKIPPIFGLDYHTCDHCGSTHSNRVESHILYNTKTETWMQVGSSCVNKLVDGAKYLNDLMIKLHNIINMCGGCETDPFGWEGSHWRPSSKYLMEAIRFDQAITTTDDYRKNISKVWIKPEYERSMKVCDGTNDFLMHHYNCNKTMEVNTELYNTVKAHFDSLEYDEVVEYERNLRQKIKDAFKDEYITLMEMYLAWFAIDICFKQDAIEEFKKKIEQAGIVKGNDFEFFGEVTKIETREIDEEDYYHSLYPPPAYDYYLQDDLTGITFVKAVSSRDAILKYKNPDTDKLHFIGTIGYINNFKQYINFTGRLKKAKEPKEPKKIRVRKEDIIEL